MANYVFLFNYTEEGQRTYKDSPKRAVTTAQLVESVGGRMKTLLWMTAKFDGLFIADLPNDEAAAAVSLSVTSKGFIRTSAVRAFDREEFVKIAASLG